MSAQLRQPSLPQGAIAMEATTPIAGRCLYCYNHKGGGNRNAILGLLRWCVLAPIYQQDEDVYSKLYLALLNSISEIPKTNPPRAINVQHLSAIVHPLYAFSHEVKPHDLQLAIDRFAQAIQVALSVNAVYGHLDDLFKLIQLNLPFNKLMSIVVGKFKQAKSGTIIIV